MGAFPQGLPDLGEIVQIADGRQLSRELAELAGVALDPVRPRPAWFPPRSA